MSVAARQLSKKQLRPPASAPALRVISGGADKGRPAEKSLAAGRAKNYRRGGVAFLAVGVSTVAAFVFGLVLVNIHLAQTSFQLVELQKQVSSEEARYRQMRYEIALEESPVRLDEAATRLGLVAPERQEYILGPQEAASNKSQPGERSGSERSLSEQNLKALLSKQP